MSSTAPVLHYVFAVKRFTGGRAVTAANQLPAVQQLSFYGTSLYL